MIYTQEQRERDVRQLRAGATIFRMIAPVVSALSKIVPVDGGPLGDNNLLVRMADAIERLLPELEAKSAEAKPLTTKFFTLDVGVVSHERAREAMNSLVDEHFKNTGERVRRVQTSIPARADDTDIVLSRHPFEPSAIAGKCWLCPHSPSAECHQPEPSKPGAIRECCRLCMEGHCQTNCRCTCHSASPPERVQHYERVEDGRCFGFKAVDCPPAQVSEPIKKKFAELKARCMNGGSVQKYYYDPHDLEMGWQARCNARHWLTIEQLFTELERELGVKK